MCGICGILTLGNVQIPREALIRMNATMVHRGPDDEGYYHQGSSVGLAMRRLSIIDCHAGHQPIHNEDCTIWLIFNGEIYNYQELKNNLHSSGHKFYTSSDTEVLVHLYEEYGYRFVDYLRGMFAFALYDHKKNLLLLGRDRLGKKPLYYAADQNYLIFASEIKTIHASLLVSKKLNHYALDSYLSHGFVAGPYTMFKGVQKLPAGCLLVVQDNKMELKRYWDLPRYTVPLVPTPEIVPRLWNLLEEAVRIRLMSEVPLGAFLSGGIDSSAVVGIMSRQLTAPVKTFSVSFGDSKIDELCYAREISRYFGTDHHEFIITGCPPELLHEINWYYDEPAADPAIVPTFLLSQFTKRAVTVALTGEGGDELFGGYHHYRTYHKLLAVERRLCMLRNLARGLEPLSWLSGRLGNRRFWKGIWIAGLSPEERPRGWLSIFTDSEKKRLCHREFRDVLSNEFTEAVFSMYQERVRDLDYLTQSMYIDSKLQLADQFLMKVDKMSMASSLEARCPLLDHKLVEFVATLPIEEKISGLGSKLILRKALSDFLPKNILTRPKQGFEVPLRKWLKQDLTDCIHDLLLQSNSTLFDFIDQSFVRSLWVDFSNHQDQQVARQLWLLLNLAVWWKMHWN